MENNSYLDNEENYIDDNLDQENYDDDLVFEDNFEEDDFEFEEVKKENKLNSTNFIYDKPTRELLQKIVDRKINHTIYHLLKKNINLPHNDICHIFNSILTNPRDKANYLLLKKVISNPRKDKICVILNKIINNPHDYKIYTLLRDILVNFDYTNQTDNNIKKYLSCKDCDHTNKNSVMTRLQNQKIIQNVVRVPSSSYQDNLSAINVFEKPFYYNQTNCNQSSDRLNYHVQQVVVPSHCNTLKFTKTSIKPGACSPGGIGVDIKHNSYARYLNRLKGKGPYKKDIIPPEQLLPEVPFNRAFPIYGDKFVKLNIINNCIMPCGCK